MPISPDSFQRMQFQLAEGEAMLLVSDGVVEASNSQRELFGFDCTRDLSMQSAEKIAAAAQQFGQEDDITVLTLSFAPVAVYQSWVPPVFDRGCAGWCTRLMQEED